MSDGCGLGPETCSDCARSELIARAPDAARWKVGSTFEMDDLADDEKVRAVVPYGWAIYRTG